jgi:beta-barrel assembly-enhancing protease
VRNARILASLGVLLLIVVLAVAASCQQMQPVIAPVAKVGSAVGVGSGVLTKDQGAAINKSADAVSESMKELTPRQEHFVGRSVAAILIDKYKPYSNKDLNAFLNTLGQTLAAASDRPETYRGYHFLALDSDEISAFAAPGGLILVSRGLIRLCKTEDALAAVLAHEVGHVQLKHGIGAIQKGRVTQALKLTAAEGAKSFGGVDPQLVQVFEDSLGDVVSTLVNNGYSRSAEYEADKVAVTIVKRVGYNPRGLEDMLQEMQKQLRPGGPGFSKTHPAPSDRVAEIKPLIAGYPAVSGPPERQARFEKAVKGI